MDLEAFFWRLLLLVLVEDSAVEVLVEALLVLLLLDREIDVVLDRGEVFLVLVFEPGLLGLRQVLQKFFGVLV